MPIPIEKLVRTRRKTVALIIERDGSLTVRAPLRLAEKRIHEFVESHREWITKNQARAQASSPISPKRYQEGQTCLFLGRPYPLTIVPHQRSALSFDGSSFLMVESALPNAEMTFIRWYKAQAAALISERVRILAEKYGFFYHKIRISSARTRWGSCSSLSTLSFTYRLIMTPPEVIDYVILHELVHTRIRNHSKIFWNKVGELMPDYKMRLDWLKKNGKFLV